MIILRKVDLTQGNVFFVLLSLTIPIVGSSFLQFTYSLVDMLWLGSLGSDSVASVGSSSFFINLGYAINTLVVVGTGIKVSHSLGKNDDEQVKSYINVGIFINFILATLYSLALIFFGDNLGFPLCPQPVVQQIQSVYESLIDSLKIATITKRMCLLSLNFNLGKKDQILDYYY